MLENDSIIELNDEIPFGEKRISRFLYTTLDRFIDAKNTDYLLEK